MSQFGISKECARRRVRRAAHTPLSLRRLCSFAQRPRRLVRLRTLGDPLAFGEFRAGCLHRRGGCGLHRRRDRQVERRVRRDALTKPCGVRQDLELASFHRRDLRHGPVGPCVPLLVAVHLSFLLLSAEGRLREVQLLARRRLGGRGRADAANDLSLYDRCTSRGLPGSRCRPSTAARIRFVQAPGFEAM